MKRFSMLCIGGLLATVGLCSCDGDSGSSSQATEAARENFEVSNGRYNLWVESYKVSCEGVAPQQCYLVQSNAQVDEIRWEYFYDEIEGFDDQYEEGTRYLIDVESFSVADPPADASSIRLELREIVSQTSGPPIEPE